jgi:hypothetical protein
MKKKSATHVGAAKLVEHPRRRRIEALQVLFRSTALIDRIRISSRSIKQEMPMWSPD